MITPNPNSEEAFEDLVIEICNDATEGQIDTTAVIQIAKRLSEVHKAAIQAAELALLVKLKKVGDDYLEYYATTDAVSEPVLYEATNQEIEKRSQS